MRILLVSNEPLTEAVANRLNLNVLLEKNNITDFAFFLPLDTHSRKTDNNEQKYFSASKLTYHKIRSWISAIKFGIRPTTYDVVIWLFPITRWRSLIAFYILRFLRITSKTGLLYIKPLTFPSRDVLKTFKSNGYLRSGFLERILNFILRKLKLFKVDMDFVIVSGSEAEVFLYDKVKSINTVKKIYTLSFNASQFMRKVKHQHDHPIISCPPRGIFIDQGLPLHPDYRNGKLDPDEYYNTLKILIERAKIFYSCRIDISLHPRIDRSKSTFKNSNIIKSSTFEVIDDYDFGLTMFSSAAEWFILSGKPMIVISPSSCLELFPEATGMAEVLGLKPITELSSSKSFPKLQLNSNIKDHYITRYCYQKSQTNCVWSDTLIALPEIIKG